MAKSVEQLNEAYVGIEGQSHEICAWIMKLLLGNEMNSSVSVDSNNDSLDLFSLSLIFS